MTDHTAKNLIGRDLINLRDCLARCREAIVRDSLARPTAGASELLMRLDTLVFRHADPELDIARRWAGGDYRDYPQLEDE